MSDSVGVVWFRRDLRLADHPALVQAVAVHHELVALEHVGQRRGQHLTHRPRRHLAIRRDRLQRGHLHDRALQATDDDPVTVRGRGADPAQGPVEPVDRMRPGHAVTVSHGW